MSAAKKLVFTQKGSAVNDNAPVATPVSKPASVILFAQLRHALAKRKPSAPAALPTKKKTVTVTYTPVEITEQRWQHITKPAAQQRSNILNRIKTDSDDNESGRSRSPV